MDGGMLWRYGCDGKVLRCGAGNRHQQGVVVETCINTPNAPGVELELNSLMYNIPGILGR